MPYKFNFSSSGKVLFYVLLIILTIFLVSIIVMFSREDPEEIYKKNSNIRVEVLNGCGENRLAIRVANLLRKKGFNVVKVGNADENEFEETVVIERRSENLEYARYFAKRIGCKNIGKDIDEALYLEITLIIGKDYKRIFPDVESEL